MQFSLKKWRQKNNIKVTRTIQRNPEDPNFIEPKKTFKRNRNCQNSSYNEPLKLLSGFEVLHRDKAMPDNGIELNAIVNGFPERQHTFQRHKIVYGKKSCNVATNPRVYNSK